MKQKNITQIERRIQLPSQSVCGRYKLAIVDRDGQEIWRQKEWKNNLILNNGLDAPAARWWANCFTYASAGTGTTPTTESSGVTTAEQSTTVVTLSGGSFVFVAGDVGNVLKWNTTHEEAVITAYTSPTQVSVSVSRTKTAGVFTFYRTNQTGLTTETKRSNTYLVGAGNCETSVSGSNVIHLRTYDFTAEVGSISYTEVGLCWAASGANTHFARFLLDAALDLTAGQQLRLVYQLTITMSPTSPASKTASVTGWPVSPSTVTTGTECIQLHGLATITPASGATSGTGTTTGCSGNEPFANPTGGTTNGTGIWLSPSSVAHNTFNTTPPSRSTNSTGKAMTLSSYVVGAYANTRFCTFTTGEANRTDYRSMGVGINSGGGLGAIASSAVYCFLFDQVQAKNSTQTLLLTFSLAWGRTLPQVA